MNEYIVNLEGELGLALAVACAGAGFAREKVVRCRDCMYYREEVIEWVKNLTRTKNTCDLFDGCYVKPDGFCAWGERRSE